MLCPERLAQTPWLFNMLRKSACLPALLGQHYPEEQVTLAQFSALFKTNEVRVARQGLPPLFGLIHNCR
jgi:hypothetical protein